MIETAADPATASGAVKALFLLVIVALLLRRAR